MFTARSWIAAFMLLFTCFAGAALAEDSEKPASECVEHTTEVVYENLGYTHFVHLSNLCKRALTCVVTASSNPEPTPVELRADEKQHSIVVMRGSSANEFAATVKCRDS